MNAAVVTIGDELISGEKTDSNFPWLARRLAELGLSCVLHETVGDDEVAIARAVIGTRPVARVVLITGGLGPTSDDVTRQGVAQALGRELTFDDTVAARLSARFPEADRGFLDLVLKQAYAVEQAEILMPERGTAPGLVLFDGDQILYVLPGVPAELEEMFDGKVVPHIVEQVGELEPLRRWVLRSVGLRESEIASAIGEVEPLYGMIRFGYLPHPGIVDISLTSRVSEEAEVKAAVAEIRSRLGDAIFGTDEDLLEAVVGRMLAENGLTVATAESCTGGMLGKAITDIAGSSVYYLGGVVSYSNEAKTTLLGIDAGLIEKEGAVSEAVVSAMATSIRGLLRSDLAISITGVAGPAGGTDRNPVGSVYVALAHECGSNTVKVEQPGTRDQVRRWATVTALDMIRRHLLAS